MKSSLYVVLFIAFLDLIGVGLIFPLFASMIFNESIPLLPAAMSKEVRGVLLGILISLMPLAQFFSASVWGTFSDSKGRKKPLLLSLSLALIGYILAFSGTAFHSIVLLLISRLAIGLASGNLSVVQAAIADLSTPEEKGGNFGLYSMALGVGFTIGPFIGGFLSTWGYSIPFLFAFLLVALNLLTTFFFFQETLRVPLKRKLTWSVGFSNLKKAFQFKGMRTILLAAFLHNFGWSYFFEFIPVYFITRFKFTSTELGYFYGVVGAIYALSTGLLIRPFIKKFKPETLFFAGNLLAALTIILLTQITSPAGIWPMEVLICYFIAFVAPSYNTLISNSAPREVQGEALGILSSVNAAALAFSPLFSGSIVGAHPSFSMKIGGTIMLLASALILSVFRKRLFLPK